MTRTSNLLAKAERLRAEGRVEQIGDCQVFLVRGDHATYTVLRAERRWTCNCPAIGTCSHIHAASWQTIADKVAAEPIDDLFARAAGQ